MHSRLGLAGGGWGEAGLFARVLQWCCWPKVLAQDAGRTRERGGRGAGRRTGFRRMTEHAAGRDGTKFWRGAANPSCPSAACPLASATRMQALLD